MEMPLWNYYICRIATLEMLQVRTMENTSRETKQRNQIVEDILSEYITRIRVHNSQHWLMYHQELFLTVFHKSSISMSLDSLFFT